MWIEMQEAYGMASNEKGPVVFEDDVVWRERNRDRVNVREGICLRVALVEIDFSHGSGRNGDLRAIWR
jgi:hypothetical protein